MRQTKSLIDINIDALYNILKQNQGDVNDAMGYKKKVVMVTSDPLALVAEKTKVSKSREKVVVQSKSKGSDDEDIRDLKKITALLAKAFNRKKYYVKPNNNLRTSLTSSLANKKPEYVKSNKKKADEKKRDMSKEISANMVFMDKMEKVLSDSKESSSSSEETIVELSYYSSDSKSESEYKTLEYYDNSTNYGLFVDNDDDQEIFHDVVQIYHWIIDSGCSNHMTGNRALLTHFVKKLLGTVRFGNNYFTVIASYGDLVIGSMTIKKVYYVEGLGHNLFSIGKFCDKGLEVVFRKFTCFVRSKDSVDLLTGDRSLNLYTIAFNEIASDSGLSRSKGFFFAILVMASTSFSSEFRHNQ
nr:integrase, catalytic region, zinc finger, CCHC-type, peptidase aspartic, catalytic [Tanacetum cinerariifolium]